MDFNTPGIPAIGAVFAGRSPVSSMSYHEEGEHLYVVSEGDCSLRVVNCLTGKSDQPAFKCERERIDKVQSTHHGQCVLFTGKGSREQPLGQRHAVHYLSVYDNKILRKFRGHADSVTDISISPADDCFLTSSADRTVRLWNIQEAGSLAQLELPEAAEGTPHAVYDSTGLVFAVTAAMAGGNGHYVHLYDARQYNGGGFAELQVSQKSLETAIQQQGNVSPERATELSKATWNSIEFNKSGNQLLVKADQGLSVVLDGFEGTVQRVICPPANRKSNRPAVSCFSSDDKTVLCGNDDGTISCFNVETGTTIKRLEGHLEPVGCIESNPKYCQFASSCTNTALWLW